MEKVFHKGQHSSHYLLLLFIVMFEGLDIVQTNSIQAQKYNLASTRTRFISFDIDTLLLIIEKVRSIFVFTHSRFFVDSKLTIEVNEAKTRFVNFATCRQTILRQFFFSHRRHEPIFHEKQHESDRVFFLKNSFHISILGELVLWLWA